MHTLGLVLTTIFFSMMAIVSASIAVAISRGILSRSSLTIEQRRWTVANWLYWSALMIGCLVSVYVTNHNFNLALGIALGVGLLSDFVLPRSEQTSLLRDYRLVRVAVVVLSAWLIIKGVVGLV